MSKAPAPITNATSTEKLEALFNQQRLRNEQRKRDAGTFLSHTHSDEGGRFAKPMNVVGATPVPEYPAAPNWAPQAVGVEPPLGFDINETPVVGEPWEVEASLERAEQQASPQSLDAQPPARGGETVPLTSSATSSASPTQSQIQAETSQPAETSQQVEPLPDKASQQSLRSRRKPTP